MAVLETLEEELATWQAHILVTITASIVARSSFDICFCLKDLILAEFVAASSTSFVAEIERSAHSTAEGVSF